MPQGETFVSINKARFYIMAISYAIQAASFFFFLPEIALKIGLEVRRRAMETISSSLNPNDNINAPYSQAARSRIDPPLRAARVII